MSSRVAIITAAVFISLCFSLEDKDFWRSRAKEELEDALKIKWNLGKAKNVILFIGDGMGINTITATRIYKGGEQSKLAFESFPHVGLLKTYSVNKQVPDSASTATALFSGVKTNNRVVGVDSAVPEDNCEKSLNEMNHLDNFFDWAYSAGKRTGFVTTTRVTHATPAPIYAHSPKRVWECESKIPESAKACKDIGRQLVEEVKGKRLHVIMGGGRQTLVSNSTAGPQDPIDTWACYRRDGRNLIEEWKKEKGRRGVNYAVVTNTGELQNLSINTEFVLGVFANSHLNYDYIRDTSPSGMPSLQQMTEAALKLLYKGNEGFVVLIEGGLIDIAHHRGHARKALDEAVAFDRAINWTMNWLSENNILDETLVIVTADHDHSLMINGHPDRGTDILGLADRSPKLGLPYTTLTYSTGGGNNIQFISVNDQVQRINPLTQDTTDFEYSQQATVLLDEVKHGGADVIVFAKGPMAHLFHNVHEQNYLAYVVAYAAKIGPYSASSASRIISSFFKLFVFLYIVS